MTPAKTIRTGTNTSISLLTTTIPPPPPRPETSQTLEQTIVSICEAAGFFNQLLDYFCNHSIPVGLASL